MSFQSVLVAAAICSVGVYSQQAGTLTAETRPSLPISECTTAGCTTLNTEVTLDANWRWTHSIEGSTNCYTGNEWDTTICSSPAVCAQECALDGADYAGTYGISAAEDALTLSFVTGSNVGSRTYLMAEGGDEYQMFDLRNKEFTFTVDSSKLPCGLNGALYFVEMAADGGMSASADNKAGARYGTGYCDSQCPKDIKFINGEANTIDWVASQSSSSTGTGSLGACCAEMDIWEANSISSAFTPHPCNSTGLEVCDSDLTCGVGESRQDGICDRDGCDFNSYRMGNESFYGPSGTIDSASPVTVVTQFITDDGTDNGTLTEIRRIYIQDGKMTQNSMSDVEGVDATNSITESFCEQQKTAFGDANTFAGRGGIAGMGQSFARGMVLVMSIWDDYSVNMLWLDSSYPANKTGPGVNRGTCDVTGGVPAVIEKESGDATVIYSAIKFGALNSTFTAV